MGSEIWCPQLCDLAAKLQLRYYKLVLNISKSTPTFMVLGELGRYPIEIPAKCRMLNFWFKLRDPANCDNLSNIIYKFLLNMYNSGEYTSNYMLSVHNELNSLGFTNLWVNQSNLMLSSYSFKKLITRRLCDQFVQKWYAELHSNALFFNYRIFKERFEYERYLLSLPECQAKQILKFRTLNHRLPIQKGRTQNIAREDRVCTKCDSNSLGDEFHFIFVCPFFNNYRKDFIKPYFYRRPNTIKFKDLFTSKKKKIQQNLSKFVRIIMNHH